MIKGNKIELIPATLSNRRIVYEWGFASDITKFLAGPPHYPDQSIATWEEFCEDYVDYYFDDSQPEKGRGYIINFNGDYVGFISYSSSLTYTELDIWMRDELNCGKGLGTDAIITLGNYLNKKMLARKLVIRPSIKNIRAIKAYLKAGFKKTELTNEQIETLYGEGDYGFAGDILLIKEI